MATLFSRFIHSGAFAAAFFLILNIVWLDGAEASLGRAGIYKRNLAGILIANPAEPYSVGAKLRMFQKIKKLGAKPEEAKPRRRKAYDGLRLKMMGAISEENMKIVEEAGKKREGEEAVRLVRLEPRRDRKIRKTRRVWKPWVRYMLETMRLSGYVYDYYHKQEVENYDDEEFNTLGINMNLSARTFIWRPWFSTLDGSVGVAASRTNSSLYNSDNQTLVGDIMLTVFPSSRFPFRASYGRERTDQSREFTDSIIEQEWYTFTQLYQGLRGGNLFLSYDHRNFKTDYLTASDLNNKSLFTETETDSYVFNASKNYEKHSLSLSSNINNNRRVGEDQETGAATVVAIHHYTPGAGMSVENIANYYNISNRYSSDQSGQSIGFESDRDILQVTSNGYWRSSDRDLNVNTGLRYYGTMDTRNSRLDGERLEESSSTSASGNAFAGLNYRMNDNLSFYGSANFNKILDPADGPSSSTQSAGLSYLSNEVDLSGWRYTVNAQASAQSQLSDERNTMLLQPGLGHGVRKGYGLSENTLLSFNFNQNYSVSHYVRASHGYEVPDPQTQQNITHSASSSLTSQGKWGRGAIRLTATDTRTRGLSSSAGGGEQTTQLVYLQANFDKTLSKYSKIYGDWNIQYSRGSIQSKEQDERVNSRGIAAYRNIRLFGMRGLVFQSEVRMADESFFPEYGDINDNETLSWENRLEYRIGRIEALALYRISEVNTIQRNILMLRIVRNFGN